MFSRQHSATAFTRVLDMEMSAERSEHWRHRLLPVWRQRWALFWKKKKNRYCRERRGRERGSPWASPVPKSLILTSLISIRRHRLSSIIRLNRESTFSQPSKAYRTLSSAKKEPLESVIQAARSAGFFVFFFFFSKLGRWTPFIRRRVSVCVHAAWTHVFIKIQGRNLKLRSDVRKRMPHEMSAGNKNPARYAYWRRTTAAY